MPPAFFNTILDPDFRPAKGIVYILPAKQTTARLFGFQPPAVTAPVTGVAAAQAPGTTAALQLSLQAPQAAPAPAGKVTAAGDAAAAQ